MGLNGLDLDLPDMEYVPSIITCTIEGIMQESDLAEILEDEKRPVAPRAETRSPSEPQSLARLKERHHSVARLIASGVSQRLVAEICNYTESYLSILLDNPAMVELIELYRAQHNSAALLIAEKLRTVGTEALQKLSDKLEADEIPVSELVAIAKLGLDRAGHGPQHKHEVTSTQHVIDHAKLIELEREAREKNARLITPRQSQPELEAPQ